MKEYLTFDDVLLVPQYSTIKSRSEVDLSVNLSKGIKLRSPIIPANMKNIISYQMAVAMYDQGAMSLLHRFSPIDKQIELIKKLKELENIKPGILNFIGVSVGVKPEDKENLKIFNDLGIKIVCIDIAHLDSVLGLSMIEYISKNYPHMLLIAGNVATDSGAAKAWQSGADIVKVGIGAGCLAAGTRILMENGQYKNIEEIVPGEFVINKNGIPVKVLKSFCTGIKEVVSIKNNSFYKNTLITTDHQMFVGDYSGSKNIQKIGYKRFLDKKSKSSPNISKYKWKQVKNLNNDVFLLPKKINFNLKNDFSFTIKKRIGGNQKSEYIYKNYELKPNYDLGYIFGTFIGDGCAHKGIIKNKTSNIGSISWYFGLNELSIAKKLQTCIKNVFNLEAKILEKSNVLQVKFYFKPFADFLQSFGKKTNKHLPNELLISNNIYLSGIKDGLIDSDGSIEKNNNRTSITNTSPQIIELFNILSNILDGGMPNNFENIISGGNLKNINIENCNKIYSSRILINIKNRETKDFFIVKKILIEKTNLFVPVYDLEVDCETHSFIANNMIVHNSICSTRLETGHGVPQLSAIMEIHERRKKLEQNLNKKLYFISDGGHRKTADIVKSLCFADMVMIGSMLAGTTETSSKDININGEIYKAYEGSSTHKTTRVEGVKGLVKPKGSVIDIVKRIHEGIQSACSYQNSHNLQELKEDPDFIKVSASSLTETNIHDVKVVE